MDYKKELIGHTYHCKAGKIVINEDNKELLISLGADIFKKEKSKVSKFKGIKEDDNKDSEGAE